MVTAPTPLKLSTSNAPVIPTLPVIATVVVIRLIAVSARRSKLPSEGELRYMALSLKITRSVVESCRFVPPDVFPCANTSDSESTVATLEST